jgi:hypothetical protein
LNKILIYPVIDVIGSGGYDFIVSSGCRNYVTPDSHLTLPDGTDIIQAQTCHYAGHRLIKFASFVSGIGFCPVGMFTVLLNRHGYSVRYFAAVCSFDAKGELMGCCFLLLKLCLICLDGMSCCVLMDVLTERPSARPGLQSKYLSLALK